MSELHKGACLCGRVSFSVSGGLKPPDACHCVQCRKQSGHFFASTNVPRAMLAIVGEDNLSWYPSSATVRRGFCSTCGSFLFWDPVEMDLIAIAMGAFERPTATHLEKHIFVAEKGDYYAISDELPQSAGTGDGSLTDATNALPDYSPDSQLPILDGPGKA